MGLLAPTRPNGSLALYGRSGGDSASLSARAPCREDGLTAADIDRKVANTLFLKRLSFVYDRNVRG